MSYTFHRYLGQFHLSIVYVNNYIYCPCNIDAMNKTSILFLIVLVVGSSCKDDGRYWETQAIYARERKNHHDECHYYNLSAIEFQKHSNSTKAIELYNMTGIVCWQVALKEWNYGNYHTAGDYYSKSARAFNNTNNTATKEAFERAGLSYERSAQGHQNVGDYISARYDYALAETMYKHVDTDKTSEMYKQSAIDYERVAEYYRNGGYHTIACIYYNETARAYNYSGNTDKADEMHANVAQECEI